MKWRVEDKADEPTVSELECDGLFFGFDFWWDIWLFFLRGDGVGLLMISSRRGEKVFFR